jgi:hypothetical protein
VQNLNYKVTVNSPWRKNNIKNVSIKLIEKSNRDEVLNDHSLNNSSTIQIIAGKKLEHLIETDPEYKCTVYTPTTIFQWIAPPINVACSTTISYNTTEFSSLISDGLPHKVQLITKSGGIPNTGYGAVQCPSRVQM